jgi:hypothetical protein
MFVDVWGQFKKSKCQFVHGVLSARGILSVQGVPLIHAVQGGGSRVLGPARFTSLPTWIGHPFTPTMSPTPPAFVLKSIP